MSTIGDKITKFDNGCLQNYHFLYFANSICLNLTFVKQKEVLLKRLLDKDFAKDVSLKG